VAACVEVYADPPRIGELQSSVMRRPGVMNTDGDGCQDEVVAPPGRSAVPPAAGLRRASRKRTRLVLFADLAALDGSGTAGVHTSADCLRFSADLKGVLSADIAVRSGVSSVAVAVLIVSGGLRFEAARDAGSGAGPSSRSRAGPATAWQDSDVALLPCPANSSSSAAPSLAPGDALPGDGSANGGDGMAPRRRGVLAPPRCEAQQVERPLPGSRCREPHPRRRGGCGHGAWRREHDGGASAYEEQVQRVK